MVSVLEWKKKEHINEAEKNDHRKLFGCFTADKSFSKGKIFAGEVQQFYDTV